MPTLTEPRATPALGRPNLDSNWSATSATLDGTVRIRESVPDRRPQPPGFAGVRVSGTVRAERTRPAESPANGLAGGDECGAILPPPPTGGGGAVYRSPARQLAGLRLESASVRGVLREGDVACVIAERDAENADAPGDGLSGARSCSLIGSVGRERQRAVNRFGRPERGRLTGLPPGPSLLHAVRFAERAERDDGRRGVVLWIARERTVENAHQRARRELISLLQPQ